MTAKGSVFPYTISHEQFKIWYEQRSLWLVVELKKRETQNIWRYKLSLSLTHIWNPAILFSYIAWLNTQTHTRTHLGVWACAIRRWSYFPVKIKDTSLQKRKHIIFNRRTKLTIMSGSGIFTFVSIISVLFALLRSIYGRNTKERN